MIARQVDRTYQKVIVYTYTYQQANPELYASATADYDPSLPMPDADKTPAVRQCGVNDWLLTLSDEPETPGVDLIMALPDEHLARCCALQWPLAAESIRAFVLEVLENAIPER